MIFRTQDLSFSINFADIILATRILIFNINTVVSNCNTVDFKSLPKVSSFRKAILFKVRLVSRFSLLNCTAYLHTNTSSLVYECTQRFYSPLRNIDGYCSCCYARVFLIQFYFTAGEKSCVMRPTRPTKTMCKKQQELLNVIAAI